MANSMTLRELALLRLAAQRVAGAGVGTAVETVRWLTALQAQDLPGALTSVALRTVDRARESVVAALDAGEVVRSWPMRGTLHLVAAEDVGWMVRLTAERIAARTARRRAELGIDETDLAAARDAAAAALAGGGGLPRVRLFETWQRSGQPTAGQRGVHLLGHLAREGLLCLGPMSGKEQLVVLADEWIARPRRPEHDEAVGEWALRYFRGHGPASLRDFAWWTGLRVTEARAGLALAAPRLERVRVDDVDYFMDPATPALLASCRSSARGVFLLPGFDETMLGYRERGAALPDRYADRVVPGGNGMFLSTVVDGGRVVGTWRRGRRQTIDVTPFGTFSDRLRTAVDTRFRALA